MRIFKQDSVKPGSIASDKPRPQADAAGRAQVQLEITRGRARRKMRDVTSPVFLIGADAECDLVLGDPSCAGVHLYLFVREDGVFLRAIARTPEVRVNGEIFRAGEILDGSRIAMGGYEFCVHVKDSGPGSRKKAPADKDGRYIPFAGNHDDPQGVQAVQRLLRDIRMDITREKLKVYTGPQLGAMQLPAYLSHRDTA